MAVFDEGGVAAAGAYLRRGLLIPDDAGTVSHVYFNGAGLVDKYGNAWTQNGTVPQVARSGRTPPGAGPFAGANYYSLPPPSAISALPIFSACFVYRQDFNSSLMSDTLFDVSTNVSASGWMTGYSAPLGWFLMNGNNTASVFDYDGAPASGAGMINVACSGYDGTNAIVKRDLRPSVSGPRTITPEVGASALISRPVNPFGSGKLYEMWISTTTPTDALFTAIEARVKARLGIVQW